MYSPSSIAAISEKNKPTNNINSQILIGLNRLLVIDESRNWPLCGGNKYRKIDRILSGKKHSGILTYGSKYSSHCLAATYWGTERTIPVRLIIIRDNFQGKESPNIIASKHLGAQIVETDANEASATIEREQARYKNYTWIAGGGHCKQGFEAYRDWFFETLKENKSVRERDEIVLPYGTGTTALGILAAVIDAGLSTRVTGVSVARSKELCLEEARKFLPESALNQLNIIDKYEGKYGVQLESDHETRIDFLRNTGILPDPIYNVRSASYIRQLDPQKTLIIHTGGQLNNLAI